MKNNIGFIWVESYLMLDLDLISKKGILGWWTVVVYFENMHFIKHKLLMF